MSNEIKLGLYPTVRELNNLLCDIRCKVNMMGSELVSIPITDLKTEEPECCIDDLKNSLIFAMDINKRLDEIIKILRGDD